MSDMADEVRGKERYPETSEEPCRTEEPIKVRPSRSDINRITIEVIERIRQEMPTPELLGEVVNLLADRTGFEAVGMRLKVGDDYPYFQTRGMSEEFVRLENSLCPRKHDSPKDTGNEEVTLECACGRVIQGRVDRSEPFIDEYGSFWTNNNTQLLSERPEIRESIRGNCVQSGYETSALVPIRIGDRTLGLLQFEDRRQGMLSGELLSAMESVAVTLALVLSQRQYAEGLQREKETLEQRVIERSRELSEVHEAAREALQQARDDLELRVEERTDELSRANLMLEEEISERKLIERHSRATNQILRLMADASGRQEYLDGIVELVKEWTGLRCVGIRILDSEGNIPYASYTGFDRGFWEKENWLSLSRDNCACTRVVAGAPEPQDSCCMTEKGSFLINDSRKLVESLTEDELSRFRGVCIQSDFLSIAVVPVCDNGDLVGGIHLADERAGMVPELQVQLLEGLSRLIGEGIIKFNAKDALEKKQELLQNVVSRIPVMLSFFDASGNPLLINPEFERLLGWSFDDAVKTDFLAECYPDLEYRREAVEYMAKGVAEWREFRVRAKSGEIVDSAWSNVILKDGSHIGIGIDLRERKKAEKVIAEQARLLEAFFKHTMTPLAFLDKDFNFIRVNESYAKADARRVEDFPGRNHFELYPHPENQRVFERVIRTNEPYLALAKPFEYPDHPERGITYWDWSLIPILDNAGEVDFLVFSLMDVTERKRTEEELQDYTRKLQESNRALQDFASIASHDMQEPLRKILSFGKMLSQQYGESLGDRGSDYLKRMQTSAERMQNLLNALLDYARVTTRLNPFIPVYLPELIQEVLEDLEVRIAQTGGKVIIGDFPEIQGDFHQMRQLFQNLIGNALKYRGEKQPLVRVYGEEANCGTLARIYVEDNGIGFEEKYLDRIFHPFQRLHGRGRYEGTGMGLAICKKIVERHGGTITARSRPGAGSIFIIELPICQPRAQGRAPYASTPQATDGNP
jgi:PAS domain S-box-containing protein